MVTHKGRAKVDVTNDRMGPQIKAKQVFGTAFYSAKSKWACRVGDIMEFWPRTILSNRAWPIITNEEAQLPAAGIAKTPPPLSVKRLLPWLVAVAFFMESLDTTILNTAVPVISKALAVTPLSMKSVLASYTLSLAVFIPISGWVADRYGTRRVFASAIGIFTLGWCFAGCRAISTFSSFAE